MHTDGRVVLRSVFASHNETLNVWTYLTNCHYKILVSISKWPISYSITVSCVPDIQLSMLCKYSTLSWTAAIGREKLCGYQTAFSGPGLIGIASLSDESSY
jgi:hypothetical protein